MASDLGPDDVRKAVDARRERVSAGTGEEAGPPPEGGAEETAAARGDGRARLLPVAVGLVALAAFAGIVWYAYTWGLGRGEAGALPVVKAEDGPEKVRPEDPGGMEVRHQDKLVLNQGGAEGEGAQVERLLPPPETPQPPEPAAEDEAAAAPAADDAAAADGPEEAAPSNGADAGAEATPTQTAAAEEDMDLEPEMPAAPDPEPDAATTAESEPAAPDAAAEAAAEQAPAGSEPAAEAAAATSVGQLAQADGRFLIQLASLTSRERAEREWARLRERHPDLLAGAELTVERVEIEGKGTFYRVQTGPFPNRATAEDMCGLLKAADQACLVVRR